MSRVCCVVLGLAVWLASLIAVRAGDTKTPRTDLYGDPLPQGAVMRLGTIRLRHAGDVAFSKDGKELISCDIHRQVRVWDVATGKLQRQHRLRGKLQEGTSFNTVTLSPNGALTAAYNSGEETVLLFDSRTGEERGRMPSIKGTNRYLLMTFSLDGKCLAVQTETKENQFQIQIWDLDALKMRQTFAPPTNVPLCCVAFSPDSKWLAGIAEAKDASGKRVWSAVDLFLWNTVTGKLHREQKQLRGIDTASIAFAPDGKTLALGCRSEPVVRLLAVDTLKEKCRLSLPKVGPEDYLISPIFSLDGRYFAASFGSVRHNPNSPSFTFDVPRGGSLWDLAEAKTPRRIWALNESPRAFAPDGKTLACRKGSEVRLYYAASGRPLHNRPGHADTDLALAVASDGKTIASGDCDGILRVWDAATSKQIWVSESSNLRISELFFSANGQRVAGGNMGGPFFDFQTWDTATGKKMGRIFIHKTYACLHAAALSADGQRFWGVFTKEVNQPPCELIFWDVATGKRLGRRLYRLRIEEHPNGTTISAPAVFSKDGEQLTVWLGDRMGIAEVSTGCLLAKLPKGLKWPSTFSPDGRLFLALTQYAKDEDSEQDNIEEQALIESASGQEILRLKWMAPNKVAFTPDGLGLVVSDHKKLSVWDTRTGEKLCQMAWPDNIARTQDRWGHPYIPSLAALPGGRVAASMAEGDILVWDLQRSRWPKRRPRQELDHKELEALWSDLAGDARKAYRAMHTMTASPASAVAFFQIKFRPMRDGKHIERLLADLDGDTFSAREKALRELKRMPYRAEPMLRKALANNPSLEMRRRIEPILAEPRFPNAEDLRMLRALTVLEYIGTPEARRILEEFADGTAAPETRAAKAALQRLQYR